MERTESASDLLVLSLLCFVQWLLFLFIACVAHGAMSTYGIMLQNDVYAIARRRVTEVRPGIQQNDFVR